MAGRKQKIESHVEEFVKLVDLGDRNMLETPIFAGVTENLPGKPHAKTVVWSYDVEGHAKKCVER